MTQFFFDLYGRGFRRFFVGYLGNFPFDYGKKESV